MGKKKGKPLIQIISEIQYERYRWNGLIKHPEKKFNEWETDFNEWEKRFTKRMTKFEKFLQEQAGNMERFFD